jgi:hypothetical protein
VVKLTGCQKEPNVVPGNSGVLISGLPLQAFCPRPRQDIDPVIDEAHDNPSAVDPASFRKNSRQVDAARLFGQLVNSPALNSGKLSAGKHVDFNLTV